MSLFEMERGFGFSSIAAGVHGALRCKHGIKRIGKLDL